VSVGRAGVEAVSRGPIYGPTRSYRRPDLLPDADETLLLVAGTAAPGPAAAAWEAWLARGHSLDEVSETDFAIVSCIYRNLREVDPPVAQAGRLHGVYRRTWYENRIVLSRAEHGLRLFAAAGIPTMLLKGGALLTAYQDEVAARRMRDIDVMVPSGRAREAAELLIADGFRIRYRPKLGLGLRLKFTHGAPFRSDAGHVFDLHWRPTPERIAEQFTRPFWENARPIEYNGIPTHVPAPEELLLQVVLHGLRRSRLGHLPWALDAVAILEYAGDGFDWRRVLRQARARQEFSRFAAGIRFLGDRLDVALPEPVARAVAGAPTELPNRPETVSGLRQVYSRRLDHYLRLTIGWPWHARLRGLPVYLAYMNDLESTRDLGAHSRRRAIRVLRRARRGR
jgi:hypothetical protein